MIRWSGWGWTWEGHGAEACRMRRERGGGRRFFQGRRSVGCRRRSPKRIFAKFNPHYMFPEGHALAFAFTDYQDDLAAALSSVEFYVALFSEQPIGFWDLDTLKQDARRLGLRVAHPCVNWSAARCTAEGDNVLRLGLSLVKG